MPDMLSASQAIDIFVQSFSYSRSLTHPVEIVEVGPLRALRDVPGRKSGPRTEEIIAPPGSSPEDVVTRIRDYQPRGRYLLDVSYAADETADGANDFYKRHGYRRMRTEPLMALALEEGLPARTPRHDVQRVETQAQADAVAKAARAKQIHPEHLSDSAPAVRVYYVEKDGRIVAWARTVTRQRDVSYLAGMFTDAAYRRQGIATALLQTVSDDHALAGASYNILLASRLGSLLYTSFGYKQIGSLVMYAPKR
jgi:GNAT superfamily N-acetyltransferase